MERKKSLLLLKMLLAKSLAWACVLLTFISIISKIHDFMSVTHPMGHGDVTAHNAGTAHVHHSQSCPWINNRAFMKAVFHGFVMTVC